MNDTELARLAAIVTREFHRVGIEIVILGGSALSLHVPQIYMSEDIDIAVGSADVTRSDIGDILAKIGFEPQGRTFVHPRWRYTIDFVAHTPLIDQREISAFVSIETSEGPVRTYYFEDAIADRISAYLYWSDKSSLDVALRALKDKSTSVDMQRLSKAIEAFEVPNGETKDALAIASNEIERTLGRTLYRKQSHGRQR